MSQKKNKENKTVRLVCYVHPELAKKVEDEAKNPEFVYRSADVVRKALLCYFGLVPGGYTSSGHKKLVLNGEGKMEPVAVEAHKAPGDSGRDTVPDLSPEKDDDIM